MSSYRASMRHRLPGCLTQSSPTHALRDHLLSQEQFSDSVLQKVFDEGARRHPDASQKGKEIKVDFDRWPRHSTPAAKCSLQALPKQWIWPWAVGDQRSEKVGTPSREDYSGSPLLEKPLLCGPWRLGTREGTRLSRYGRSIRATENWTNTLK